jgi:hypothetical protein
MKIVSVGFVLISSCFMAHAMDSSLRELLMDASPVAFSETNSGTSGLSSSSSSSSDGADKGKKNDLLASPPFLALDSQIQIQADFPDKEPLLDMAELGVKLYKESGLDSNATFYFETVLGKHPAKREKNPKAVATAQLYLGIIGFKKEARLGAQHNPQRLEIAHTNLQNAAGQTADPRIAAQALLTLSRINYELGISKKNAGMVLQGVIGLRHVIDKNDDEESTIAAKFLLSHAAQTGNGMPRDLNVAFAYALDIASQRKYLHESLEGCLQCARVHMEGIDSKSWNVQNAGYAELHLARPRGQSQFEDLRSAAKGLYEKLQAKLQECRYREGLAYIKHDLPVNGYDGARTFWEKLGRKNITTMQDLQAKSPHDYAHAVNRAEYYLEGAAYDNHNPEIKAAARQKLGFLCKAIGKPNKFYEMEIATACMRHQMAAAYQEGLAYIRRAVPVSGSSGAGPFWDALEKKNIKTARNLRIQCPTDYAYMLQQAEQCFEQACHSDNADIKADAQDKLGLVYKEIKRLNELASTQS